MKLHVLLLTLVLTVFAGRASAFTISWGGATGDLLYTSYGAELDASFTFELGTFGTSFSPSYYNQDQWASNWKVLDAANVSDGWSPANAFFTSEVTLNPDGTSNSSFASPGTTFSATEQVYIWAYNTKTLAPGAEWALVTGSNVGLPSDTTWKLAAPSDQTVPTVNFRLDTAMLPEVGGLNGDRGPGSYSADPQPYELQTSAIPEPSGLLLLSLLSACLGLRRRR